MKIKSFPSVQKKSREPVLLFSFLRQLKQSDQKAFFFVVVFIVLQLLSTFVKLEAPPFFLYGMYSEKITASDRFTTIRIFINNQPLESYHPSLRERLLLEVTTENYLKMKNNAHTDQLKTRIESRYPYFYRSFFYPFLASRIYNGAKEEKAYIQWLKQKCLHLAHLQAGRVKIVQSTYILDRPLLQFKRIKHEVLEDI